MIILFFRFRNRLLYALVIFAIFPLVSCMKSHLAVYTDYLSHENLASYHIDTPDPLLNNPPIGQRLIVIWTLKKKHLLYEDLHLKISIRFRDKNESTITYPLCKPKGTYIYSILNEDYIKTGGFLTYKVELIGDGIVLDEWRHQIWTNLIQINQKQDPSENDKQCLTNSDEESCDLNKEEDFELIH